MTTRIWPGDHTNPARYLREPGPVTTQIWPGTWANSARYLGEPSPAVDASGGPVLSSFAAPRARCHVGLLRALGNDCRRTGWLRARERTPARQPLLGPRRCCARRTRGSPPRTSATALEVRGPRLPLPRQRAGGLPDAAQLRDTWPESRHLGPERLPVQSRESDDKGQRLASKNETGSWATAYISLRVRADTHARARARTNAHAHACTRAHTVPDAEL